MNVHAKSNIPLKLGTKKKEDFLGDLIRPLKVFNDSVTNV